jgi:hypothetical protein
MKDGCFRLVDAILDNSAPKMCAVHLERLGMPPWWLVIQHPGFPAKHMEIQDCDHVTYDFHKSGNYRSA